MTTSHSAEACTRRTNLATVVDQAPIVRTHVWGGHQGPGGRNRKGMAQSDQEEGCRGVGAWELEQLAYANTTVVGAAREVPSCFATRCGCPVGLLHNSFA